jgi:predicted phage terminase large subunit-like protein
MREQNLTKSRALFSLDEKAKKDLLAFTVATKNDYVVGRHHAILARKLEDVFFGRTKRLMIFMPPRHGKSEIASIRFPAWAFGVDPNKRIIGCSYGAELARKINRQMQKVIDLTAYSNIFPHTKLNSKNVVAIQRPLRNSDNFEIVGHQGTYRAAGIGGAITGTGADILVIDDPIKSQKEANSLVFRNSLWEWYTGTAYTRLEKNGAIILIQTRWHEDDLAGRLINEMNNGGEHADKWDILNLEAIKETENKYDWREIGEPLWPWKYSLNSLLGIKSVVGSMVFSAQYQQRPSPIAGSLFKRQWWKYYKEIPLEVGEVIQFYDTAQKIGLSNDFTVCATWKKISNGYYLLDLWRGKLEAPELEKLAIANYNKWLPNKVVIEDKSSGSSLIQMLQRNTTLPVIPTNPKSDKVQRAIDATPTIEAGNCYLPLNASWLSDFIVEHEQFPNAAHDDIVDTTSMMSDYFRNIGTINPRIRRL